MNESPTPNLVYSRRKRAIFGGLLSAGIAAFFLALYALAGISPALADFLFSTLQIDALGFGFYAPAFLLGFPGVEGILITIPGAVYLLLCWFGIGALIAYYISKTIVAILVWIVVYAQCFGGIVFEMVRSLAYLFPS